MKAIRIISLALVAVLMVCAFASCGNQTPPTVVTVKVVDFDKKVVAEGEVSFKSDEPTALLALQYLCEAEEIECVIDPVSNTVIKIDDIEEYEDNKANLLYYWSCNYNGKAARASQTMVETGGVVEFFVASMDNTPTEIVDPDAEKE